MNFEPMMQTEKSGPVEFIDYRNSFKKFYQSKDINPDDDTAVVDFLKQETGFTNTSGKNLKEERIALELAYLSDLLEKPEFSRWQGESELPKLLSP